MPINDPPPWHGGAAFRHRLRARWIYGVPLADVNSCFKLFRTAFLKRFPIQSDGDFVHTELVAKATFLTSIMDEVPLTPKPDASDTGHARRHASADPRAACSAIRSSPSRPPYRLVSPEPAPARRLT